MPLAIRLAPEFQLLVGSWTVDVPHGLQRVLAFLAVARVPIPRSTVAGRLWLDVPEWRALGNLRSALWRLRTISARPLLCGSDTLSLAPGVRVDLGELTELSSRMIRDPDPVVLGQLAQLIAATEILPGWEDDWLLAERERFRELRLHALERACDALIGAGDLPYAVQAALAAVEAEPYRESAYRLLIRAHLRQGNRAAAVRAYHRYRDLVRADLGIEPSELMDQLVAGFWRRD